VAFSDKEISTQDGRPVSLYFFKWGNTEWRYTSADRDITISEIVAGVPTDKTYTATPMKDNGMVQGTSSQNELVVEGPANLPIVDLFRGTPPSETIWLTVRRKHMGENDTPIYWKGKVLNLRRPSLAKCSIVGKPIAASLKRTGLRLCWTKECPHFLYGPGCNLDPEDFVHVGETESTSATQILIKPDLDIDDEPIPFPFDDQYFRGGYVQWEVNTDGTVERRFIENQTGGLLTIFGLITGLADDAEIRLYPGCDHLPATCDGKFDNLPNYGGFDKMPGQSPFGTSIF